MLKFQYVGHLIEEPTQGKDLDAGKDWKQDKKEQQRMRWLDGITD